MEFKNIFISLVVVIIGFMGIFALVNQFNTDYGTQAGDTFNNTANQVKLYQNTTQLSISASENLATTEASGQSSGSVSDLIKQSLSTIKLLPRLAGMSEAIIRDIGSGVLKIPSSIIELGIALFVFIFALTIAYLLLIGSKKL